VDRHRHQRGILASRLPFDELRRRSRINDRALEAAGRDDFPARIRDGLPPEE